MVEAVEAGQFSVYAVGTVEEAIELLTGMRAGERGLDGTYPPDTIYGRVAQRLQDMVQAVADWGEAEIKPGGHIITE